MPGATPTIALSLSHSEAAQWNKPLLRDFQAELDKNPEDDLLSMFPESYRRKHRNAQYLELP